MSEDVPTTEQVRSQYSWLDGVGGRYEKEEFDRWLASVKAEAWHEGYTAGASWNDGVGEYFSRDDNPYGAADTTKDAY